MTSGEGIMNKRTRAPFLLVLAAGVLIVLTSGAFAVSTYLKGGAWNDVSAEYRRGYAAGAVDMLRALADADYIAPAVRAEAARLVKCVDDRSDADIVRMFERHLSRNASVKEDSVAPAIYVAMRDQCGR
jgi:hypothetical protein